MAGLFDQQTTSRPRSRTHVTNTPHSSSDASDGGRRRTLTRRNSRLKWISLLQDSSCNPPPTAELSRFSFHIGEGGERGPGGRGWMNTSQYLT
ncbi:unnamed protein product [Ectocarpus sp. CCAP 1310/34]|nr:unnamed protein product [Ectocarpus sp. CCAP 1310/34]